MLQVQTDQYQLIRIGNWASTVSSALDSEQVNPPGTQLPRRTGTDLQNLEHNIGVSNLGQSPSSVQSEQASSIQAEAITDQEAGMASDNTSIITVSILSISESSYDNVLIVWI